MKKKPDLVEKHKLVSLNIKVRVYFDNDKKVRAYLDPEEFEKALKKKYGEKGITP